MYEWQNDHLGEEKGQTRYKKRENKVIVGCRGEGGHNNEAIGMQDA